MTTPEPIDFIENYRDAWATYKRLRVLSLLLWVGFLPFLWLVRYPLEWLGPRVTQYVWGALVLLWALAWIYCGISLQTWKCPRCGDSFSATWWYNKSVFATKCVQLRA
jgi:hypothetical protein